MRGNDARDAKCLSLKLREYQDYLAVLALMVCVSACAPGDAKDPSTTPPAAGTDATVSAGSSSNAGSGNAPLAGSQAAGQIALGGAGAIGAAPIAGTSGTASAGRASPFPNAGRGGSSGRAAVAGTNGAAGSSGAAGSPGPTSPAECPAPPDGTAAAAITALNAVNQLRVPAGAGCATFSQPIADGATKHCDYYAANSSNQMCIADPHSEVMSCTGFTGKSFGDRVKAAGYTGSPAFEVMAFVNNPQSAVSTWVNSVWHRIPIMSPWVTELGYGAAARCDTIDFGRGKPLPDTTLVVYPYDGQTGLPTSFDGSHEGPMPPIPATGKWPSGPPISLYAKKATFTDHVLTKDGDTTPISHVWLAPASVDAQFKNFLTDVVFMYSDAPLAAATKYRVHIKGTFVGGALDREWTFTTR
jgi:uncharacterized protein YkwD